MNSELSARQKEIITVSLQIIDESGIQGLTIKNLAKKIGFTEAAIYRHYENKTKILVAILDFFKQNSEKYFLTESETKSSVLKKIERLFSIHFQAFTATPPLVAVIFSEEIFRNEAVLVEKVQQLMKTNTDKLTLILKNGQEDNEIRTDIDASSLATIVLGSLRMFVKQWHMAGYTYDLTVRGVELINSITLLIRKN